MNENILIIDVQPKTPARKFFHPFTNNFWVASLITGLILAGGGIAMMFLDESVFIMGIVFASIGAILFLPIPHLLMRKMQAKKILNDVLTNGKKTKVTFNKIETPRPTGMSERIIDGFDLDKNENIGMGIPYRRLSWFFINIQSRSRQSRNSRLWELTYTLEKSSSESITNVHGTFPRPELKNIIERIIEERVFECIYDNDKGVYILTKTAF